MTDTQPLPGDKTNNVGRVFGLTPFKMVRTGSVSSQSLSGSSFQPIRTTNTTTTIPDGQLLATERSKGTFVSVNAVDGSLLLQEVCDWFYK